LGKDTRIFVCEGSENRSNVILPNSKNSAEVVVKLALFFSCNHIGAGLANFVSNYVSIDITGTYGNSFSSSNGLSSFRSDVIGLQVGLQIYLPKKKI
jgi:hypothetical protein